MNKEYTIKCLIVDDEPSSQQVLEHFVKESKDLHLLKTFNNTAQAYDYLIKSERVDLLFLDINMPLESGIDFYKRLPNPPQVIFTTAYAEFAVEGFNLAATDYLMKPIPYTRFLQAIEKVKKSMSSSKTDFIMLNENKVLHKVSFDNILFIEAAGDYVKVYTTHKLVITHSTFNNLYEKLPEDFIRVHKSFIVHISKIDQIMGNQIIIDKSQIPIGQTYKERVRKILSIE